MARVRVEPLRSIYDDRGAHRTAGDVCEISTKRAHNLAARGYVQVLDVEPEVGGAPVPQVRRRGRPPRDKAFEAPFDKAPADNEVPE